MKKVYELIKFSDLDDEKATQGDLYELLSDAQTAMDTKVEMFLEAMKSFAGDISNYKVRKVAPCEVRIINELPSGEKRIDLGFEIRVRKLN